MPPGNVEVDFLTRFVPAHVQRLLARSDAPQTKASDGTIKAAALVADIAGFTALTEAFEEAHAVGADKLSELLDELFDLLNGIVEAHGGESVHMAGDGLLAIWPADENEDLGDAVRYCISAGLKIQEAIAERNAAVGNTIRMRVGIGAGSIWMPVVGGDESGWFAPVGGPPLEQVSTGLNAARPGDVIVAAEAARAVGEDLVGVKTPQGLVRAESITVQMRTRESESVDLSGPALARFAPEAVATRAQAGMIGRFAEIRQATIVFVRVRELPSSPDARLAHLQLVTTRFQEAVREYGGTVSVVLLDEKGLSLVGTWGGSGHAHEDDAVRALRSAMTFAQAVGDGTTGIGVATGRTYFGDVGARAIRRFTVVGRPVNLAARLAASDPGATIRCDADTMVAARRGIAFEEQETVALKGVSESTRTFRPVEWMESVRGEPAGIVGRHRQRDLLARMFDEFLVGTGGTVFIEGEAGIGKSTLVRELLESGEPHPIRRLVVRGSALDQSAPYHPWRTVFRTLTGDSDLASAITGMLAPEERHLVGLLSDVVPVESDPDRLSEMSPNDRAEATRRVLSSAFVQLTAGAPLLLVLEDAHWYDTASWSLTEAIVKQIPSALVVCVTRGTSDPPDQAELRLRRETPVLRLHSLDLDETVALACNRLDVPSIPEELVALIYDRTEGHPLFTEELIRSLRDAAVIEITGASREVTIDRESLARLAVPSTVSAVIASRIDRLPMSDQNTLKVASVVGRSFSIDDIEAIHPESATASDIKAHLEEAAALDLIEFNDQGSAADYRFSHVLTAEAIYRLLPEDFRREMHLALATRDHTDIPESVLAHHWRSAGKDDAAAASYDRAARAAFDSGAHREVTELLSIIKTLDHSEMSPLVAARRHSLWGASHIQLGELEQAHRHLLAAVDRAGMPMPTRGWRLAAGLVWQLARQLIHRVRVRPLRTGGDVERSAVGSAAFWQMTATAFGHQDALALAYAGIRATNEAERIPATRTLAQGYSFIAYATGLVDLKRSSEAYHRRAMDAAEAADSPIAAAEALLNRGVMLTAVGKWDEAVAELTAAAEQYRQLDSRTDRARTLAVRAYVHLQSGQFEAADQLWGEVGQIGSESDLVRAWIASGQGRSLVRLGRLSEAVGILTAHRRLIDEVGELPTQLARLGFYSLALWQEGRLDGAVETATEGLEMIEGTEAFAAPHSFDGIAEICRVLLEANGFSDDEGSRLLAERAVRSLERMSRSLPIARPRASMSRAVLLARKGRHRAAARRFRRALERADALAMPYERALILREMGLSLDDQSRLEHAAEELLALGATEDARLARLAQRDA